MSDTAASSAAQTILVVDDNEANRALAQSTLEDEGYRVLLAKGGAEGIAVFERESVDCILLDIRMPEVDGFTVCERVRALPRGADTPVIFVTAQRDVDTFDHALQAGADDFLTKPVRPAELVVRVQSALKLRQMRTELQEHYELLKRQRDASMRLQLQKERLMMFVIHDLKNPVNSMDLHAQLLLRDKALSETGRGSVLHIRAEARQLNRMILNLLDLSKADEGMLSPQRADVDVRALLREVLDDLTVAAEAHKVKLQGTIEIDRARVDADLMRRLVANLVENAIRHAPAETAVTVRCERVDAALELAVIDQGKGVPLEMRERVFDPFTQVEANDGPASRTGRGLGLTFCKVAVDAHGGRIWVEDGAPGAVFRVRLPE